jgi:hypothetical protein
VPVLWGRCREGVGAPAFWPWMEIIRTCTRTYAPGVLTLLTAAEAIHTRGAEDG